MEQYGTGAINWGRCCGQMVMSLLVGLGQWFKTHTLEMAQRVPRKDSGWLAGALSSSYETVLGPSG
jgi:hypothetical protein